MIMKTVLGVLLLITVVRSARILAVVPNSSKSHFVIMEPLLKALAARGHDITVYSLFPQKTSINNYTDVDCSDVIEVAVGKLDYDVITSVLSKPFTTGIMTLHKVGGEHEKLYKSFKLDGLRKGKHKFDLMITEMFGPDSFVHFARKLEVPLVTIVTSVPLPWNADNFGLPDNPSYIANYYMDSSPEMNFAQRLVNTVSLTIYKLMFNIYSQLYTQRLVEEFFQEQLPWVRDAAKEASLLLINSHFSLGQSRPLPPNVVEIGGIHIKEKKPLPKDLQKIVDSSTQGVILLSFGSLVRVSTIPEEKIKIMMKVFSKIPQTVLMKFESSLPSVPKNVIIVDWLPQRDLLEHKNVVAIVSHGGLGGVMEAVQFGKPLVGVPFFADQFLNIHNLVWKGAAVLLDFKTMTEEEFGSAIDQVVNNPQIRRNMEQLSAQFRDRPRTAMETAVYWTEYVLRHKGAPQLRPYSVHLAWYQRELLDIVASCFTAFALLLASLYWIVRKTRRALSKSLTNTHSIKKNN